MSKGSNLILKQLSYECPGLHGPGTKQRIERRTFGNFLDSPGETGRILIPLFQRRYCWDRKRVIGWWEDVVRGKRDHLGIHNSGNVVIKKSEQDGGAWICIDGQQRLTTTSILMGSLRQALLKIESLENSKVGSDLLKKLNKILFTEAFDPIEDVKKISQVDLHFVRLLPSLLDRKSYFQCIFDDTSEGNEDDSSHQREAKSIFDSSIAVELGPIRDDQGKIEKLQHLSDLALEKMGITMCEIINEINMPQVFLWLQEKTLFGEAALLFNPTPGIDFTASDLVRNLILASVMNEKMTDQEDFYKKYWLEPIEMRHPEPQSLTKRIAAFVDKAVNEKPKKTRHISKMEQSCSKFREKFPCGKGNTDHVMTYSKFFSLYEEKLYQNAMMPPETKEDSSEEEKYAAMTVSAEELKTVSLFFLDEMKKEL